MYFIVPLISVVGHSTVSLYQVQNLKKLQRTESQNSSLVYGAILSQNLYLTLTKCKLRICIKRNMEESKENVTWIVCLRHEWFRFMYEFVFELKRQKNRSIHRKWTRITRKANLAINSINLDILARESILASNCIAMVLNDKYSRLRCAFWIGAYSWNLWLRKICEEC